MLKNGVFMLKNMREKVQKRREKVTRMIQGRIFKTKLPFCIFATFQNFL
jgi:hypothetical protein